MEKIITALWAAPDETRATFNQRLLDHMMPALVDAGARFPRLNIQDASVAAGAGLVQVNMAPPPDAIVQYWLPSSYVDFRAPVVAVLAGHVARHASWLVAESTVIANRHHLARAGERTPGFSQIALLRRPPRLDHATWRDIWQNRHTRVAIDTQANFEYIQNLVVRPLDDDAPAMDGIVEECFPIEALSDPKVFFDAVGDQARFDANLTAMMDSCARFIDFDRIDVLITSQFDTGMTRIINGG